MTSKLCYEISAVLSNVISAMLSLLTETLTLGLQVAFGRHAGIHLRHPDAGCQNSGSISITYLVAWQPHRATDTTNRR